MSFNVDDFNKEFEKNVVNVEQENNIKEITEKKPLLHELSIAQTLINLKDTLFYILDEIITLNIKSDIFTKDNRMYYIGLLIILTIVSILITNNI